MTAGYAIAATQFGLGGVIRHLDLNLLRAFITVAETGSFTAAANELNATQSTLSHRIGRLERQIGRRLLERTTRSTHLTEEGEVLLRYARQIDALAGEIRAEFSDELLTGEVRLSVPEDFVDAGFAEVFARFKRLQPRVKVELRIGLSHEQRAWLDNGEIDLAVLRSTDSESATRALWSEPIHWVAARDVARSLLREMPLAIPFVHVPAPCLYRELAMEALVRHGIHWNVVMTCPHLEGIRAAVCAGLGVAAVVESAAPRDCEILDERHGLPPLPDCNLLLECRSGMESDEAIEALRDVMSDYRWHGRAGAGGSRGLSV